MLPKDPAILLSVVNTKLRDDYADLEDLCAAEDAGALRCGMRLIDARGRGHVVSAVTMQDGLCMLHLPQGEAAYFERLFRDVRVDATLFTLVEDAPCP